MSTYPTTAELAAFRRATGYPLVLPGDFASRPPGPGPQDSPDHGGAWPREVREGIGVHLGTRFALQADHHGRSDYFSSIARREASALRSRVSDRIFGDHVTWPEQTTYAPEPYGEDTLRCDECGRFESAADLTPDWNGETGAHLSCERALNRA